MGPTSVEAGRSPTPPSSTGTVMPSLSMSTGSIAGRHHDRRFLFRLAAEHLVETEHPCGDDGAGGAMAPPAVCTGSTISRVRPSASSRAQTWRQRYRDHATPFGAPGLPCGCARGRRDSPHGRCIANGPGRQGRAVVRGAYLDGPVPAQRACDRARREPWIGSSTWCWDDGLILHTNLLLGGAWHLYRTGERWRKPSSQLRVGLTVDGFSAVCFGARTVETYREFDTHRHPGFGRAGPDLCAASPDLGAAIEALCDYDDLDAPIAEALLDHMWHAASATCFVARSSGHAGSIRSRPVSMLSRADMERVIKVAAKVLRANVHPDPDASPTARRPRGVWAQRPTLPALR